MEPLRDGTAGIGPRQLGLVDQEMRDMKVLPAISVVSDMIVAGRRLRHGTSEDRIAISAGEPMRRSCLGRCSGEFAAAGNFRAGCLSLGRA